MNVFELTRKQALGEEDFPLSTVQAKVTLMLEAKVELPPGAARRIALRELRRLVGELEEEELLNVANSAADLYSSSPESVEGDGSTQGHPAAGRGSWVQPAGLDLRIAKSAHRLILEVAKRGESGRIVYASELVGESGLSAPTIGRLLRTGDPGNAYLAQYVRVNPDGRTKSLDLTSEGRLMASKIRAGVVPM